MPAMSVKARFTGPLSQGSNRVMVRKEVNGMIRDVVEAGVERLNETLRPRPAGVYLTVEQAGPGKASIGHYRSNLHPTFGNLQARIDDNNVVYGPWLEGTSRRNQTTRFKGYASFRKTREWLDKRTKAIIRPRVLRMVRRLGGRP
jgi:hypothetical protein